MYVTQGKSIICDSISFSLKLECKIFTLERLKEVTHVRAILRKRRVTDRSEIHLL